MMRHPYNFRYILNEKTLVIVITMIFFLGLGLKTSAQSVKIGNDYDKLQSSMSLQLNDDVKLLIPKMTEEQMQMAQDAEQYMLVYKTNGAKGFYTFINQSWEKVSPREVFVNTHNNMQLAMTDLSALVLIPEGNKTIRLVDYNQHISNINAILYSNPQNYAINEAKHR